MKAHLGYLPQAFGLYEELTVWQFLDYMTAPQGHPGQTQRHAGGFAGHPSDSAEKDAHS